LGFASIDAQLEMRASRQHVDAGKTLARQELGIRQRRQRRSRESRRQYKWQQKERTFHAEIR
jgi:hypothetical protein